MSLKKYVKSRLKFRLVILTFLICLIALTVFVLQVGHSRSTHHKLNINRDIIALLKSKVPSGSELLKQQEHQGFPNKKPRHNNNNNNVVAAAAGAGAVPDTEVVVVEKYNEHDVKSRLIKEKIKYLTQQKSDTIIVNGRIRNVGDSDGNGKNNKDNVGDDVKFILDEITSHVHIFYITNINWTLQVNAIDERRQQLQKQQKHQQRYQQFQQYYQQQPQLQQPQLLYKNRTQQWDHQKIDKPNTRFYPLLGLYQFTENIINQHFTKIRDCGIGVVIITKTLQLTDNLFEMILQIAIENRLKIVIEYILEKNQSSTAINGHLQWLSKYSDSEGLYKVLSISRNQFLPFIYIKNAFNMNISDKYFCANKKSLNNNNYYHNNKETIKSAVLIGHIKSKQHAEQMRRLCFDGFYSRLPSNGANFASTWKNWSYLKTFAQTYKMIFVPTVGPGYELPKYTNLEKQRSSGRYYGVAWRTAISNHIGFINIYSFNSWEDGTQIEEAIYKDSPFRSYDPGKPRKYLDLTTHWIENFLKTSRQSEITNCYDFLNNTIC